MALTSKPPAALKQTSVRTDVAKSTSWPRPFLHGRVPDPGAYSPGGWDFYLVSKHQTGANHAAPGFPDVVHLLPVTA